MWGIHVLRHASIIAFYFAMSYKFLLTNLFSFRSACAIGAGSPPKVHALEVKSTEIQSMLRILGLYMDTDERILMNISGKTDNHCVTISMCKCGLNNSVVYNLIFP